ncbi:MAG TPA: GAF domain-containing protein, partial [Chthonomonadaceae bacterium]|nr:GAF domain-containing protein [Chthonomonadaceae bacterium]
RLREMHRRYPPDPQGDHPLAQVLRTGKPVLAAEVGEEMLADFSSDTGHLQMVRDLAPKSLICVPLIARGKTLGAITFVSVTSGRRYTPTDLMVAQELALRAALAVDHAKLYRAAQEEIAARRRMEEALRASEAQVRVLNQRLQRAMTETHHRVKNNLQLIASMVDMRLMEEMEAYPAEDLQRLSQCVGSLAVVHDLLTHGIKTDGQVEFVSAKGILERLLPLMQQTAGNSRLEFSIEDARLPAKQGTSLALVANELISNAIKHGRGEVRTTFCIAGNTAVLEVCDDGPGFPPGFDSRRAANTGLELVDSLTRTDLCGKVLYGSRPEGGGQVTVTIPLSSSPADEP